MRVVLDTNILISALITRGTPPDELYRAWLRGDIKVITATAQIEELTRVLARPRIQKYIDFEEAEIILRNIGSRAVMIHDAAEVTLSPDPADNRILAIAVAGKADLIVSGDKADMLALRTIGAIPILTARAALEKIRSRTTSKSLLR